MSTQYRSRELTLGDIANAVRDSDALPRRKQEELSALNSLATLMGKSLGEIPADGHALRRLIKAISPQAHNMSKGRWQNIRSLVTSALKRLQPEPRDAQATASAEWQALLAEIPSFDRYSLSRLLCYFTQNGVEPEMVTEDHFAGFRDFLSASCVLKDPDHTWRKTRQVWNRWRRRVPVWPAIDLETPLREDAFSLPWSEFPAALKADVDGWLRRLAGKNLRGPGPARPVKPGTLRTREYQLRAFASALVEVGHVPSDLTSLAVLVAHPAYEQGLEFWFNRKGGASSSQLHEIATMLTGVAKHWVRVPEDRLAVMKSLASQLKSRHDGLAPKNKKRLRQFEDEEVYRRFLMLPATLEAEVRRGRMTPKRAAIKTQLALAIEILTMIPIRRENLAGLDLDRHILKAGRKTLMVIPADEVKNRQELDFELPESTVRLLNWYVDEHRPCLMSGLTTALFPGRAGQTKRGDTLGKQIIQCVKQYAGIELHTHMFRHIAGVMYLKDEPGGLEIVRRVLGHKTPDTARRYYVGSDTRAATKRFDEGIIARRAKFVEMEAAVGNTSVRRAAR